MLNRFTEKLFQFIITIFSGEGEPIDEEVYTAV